MTSCVVCLDASSHGCSTCRPESERERHIRADERRRVEAEIVAWLRKRWIMVCDAEVDVCADAIERGEHRVKP